jgi:nitrite reductase/ring-hydroxylating ferredoxin subunit
LQTNQSDSATDECNDWFGSNQQLTMNNYSRNAYGPIRLAKLSEGQIVDGKLECLYHGWQFDGEGKCVKIPQVSLRPDAPMRPVNG